jgi:hypothetical protein
MARQDVTKISEPRYLREVDSLQNITPVTLCVKRSTSIPVSQNIRIAAAVMFSAA